mmetsp:Transcript_56953/g.165051  ORF Transcript_56953/g.165051 Transcript_56953/m.165051 type:complete len:471 (+) Transcript_56953:109-1521(+)
MAEGAAAEGATPAFKIMAGAALEAPVAAELKRLELAIEGALTAEEAVKMEEPESEEPGGRRADAEVLAKEAEVEASLMRLNKTVFVADQRPQLEVEALTILLSKVWQLVTIRGECRRDLAKRFVAANADARQQSERADRAEVAHAMAEAEAGQGEKAQELLESTLARLTAARKSLKEREWELTILRRRLVDAEEIRYRSEARVRLFETALDKASVARIDALAEGDRKLSEATNRAASIEAEALQRRLCASELEVGKVNAARELAENRAQELRDQLDMSRRRAEELERQLQAAVQVAAAAATEEPMPTPPPLEAPDATACSSGSDLMTESASATVEGFAPQLRPLRAGDAQLFVRGLAGLRGPQQPSEERHVEGVGILAPTPRRALRTSLNARGGTGSQAASRLASPAKMERAGQHFNQRNAMSVTPVAPKARRSTGSISEAQAPSMPMDLRALGKLLTGGGFVGKGKGAK